MVRLRSQAGQASVALLSLVTYIFCMVLTWFIVIVNSADSGYESERGMAYAMPKNRSESIPCKLLQQSPG
jgi:hypothetical protein